MKPRLKKEVAELLETEPELLPLIPELLADLETLGGNPSTLIKLVSKHAEPAKEWRVLDLGFGNGALTIAAARAFSCRAWGVDGFEPFIQRARQAAHDLGLGDRCRFEQGDLRDWLSPERPFDLLIYSAIGGLLGSPAETLGRLREAVRPGGYLYIDDGYLRAEKPTPPGYEYCLTRDAMIRALTSHGDSLVGEAVQSDEEMAGINAENNRLIRLRAEPLMRRFPEKRILIQAYVDRQAEECRHLETAFVGACWLLRRSM